MIVTKSDVTWQEELVHVQVEDLPNMPSTVREINWRLVGTCKNLDGSDLSRKKLVNTRVALPTGSFITFDDLTETTIMDWRNCTISEIEEYKDAVLKNLNEILYEEPPVVDTSNWRSVRWID